MTERTHENRTEVEGCLAKPAEQLAPWESGPSRSQGTDSVRGTWSSEGNAGHHPSFPTSPGGTSSPTTVSSRLERIATQAQKYPHTAFTTLAHHLDVALLERSFWRLNPRSSPGVDRVTWRAYERNLETHLEKLHERLVSGTLVPIKKIRKKRHIKASRDTLLVPFVVRKVSHRVSQTRIEEEKKCPVNTI